jgi:hypothetical protein
MSPARVIPSQPPNKITYLVADTWAAGKVRIRPVPADQATMPGQQRARRDDAMLPQLAGKPADEGGQHGPVRPGQTWPGNLATQHRDLMAQHHQLSDHRGLATRHLRQPAEYPNRSQLQQPNNHGPDPAPPAAKRQPTPCAKISGTVQGIACCFCSMAGDPASNRSQVRDLGRQHFLYFDPDPHQQASLRPGGQSRSRGWACRCST